ncbi:MAG TPA: asparagine synthase (glutamine-hydrolyzing) [Candidatus Omnitrophica bacterium]|nr:asparagine synthase (glutamine-hydrolyzing) [Candidatus Omnitrophota bacterium]
MCGIAGIAGKRDVVQLSNLRIMADTLAHRGPDGEGIDIIEINHNKDLFIGLVHRRLAIIDLSEAARQPIDNEDGTIWLVHNGEIYNYKDIQKLLICKGHKFKSNSDSEVILHAYEEWGTECLQRLHGMFAFGLFDSRKKILLLAVDRFGIKPLYYHENSNSLIFASELRAIIRSGIPEKIIDRLAVNSFLAYGSIQAPLTAVRGAYSILPAHYLVYDFSSCQKKIIQYWNPFKEKQGESLCDGAKIYRQLREILEESIRKHLVSDVPVGLFLSGGIDSSTLVALANKLKEGALRSFSVIFREREFSEEKYSHLISDLYCKNHTEIRISQDDIFNLMPRAFDAMDQPTIDGINVYALSKYVRDTGIKVVLSGQGGDEVFGGYPTFKKIPFMQRMYNLVRPLPLSSRKTLSNIFDGFGNSRLKGTKISQILESNGDYLALYLIERQILGANERSYFLKNNQEKGLFNGLPLEVAHALSSDIRTADVYDKISFLELRLYLANTLLRDGDFMSMSQGLEVRVPFLDHELVDYIFTVSQKIKIDKALPKPLLVNAVKDLLPKEIYLRKKMGFTFPWVPWLRHKFHLQMQEVFNDFPLNNAIGLDVNRCQGLLRVFLQNKPYVHWSQVWAIYVLMNWCNKNEIGR